MSRFFFTLIGLMLTTSLWADSFTFSERYRYFIVGRGDNQEERKAGSGSFRGSVTLPGLGRARWRNTTGFHVTVGSASFGGSWRRAVSKSATHAEFVIREEDEFSVVQDRGRMLFTRSGDTLTVTGSYAGTRFSMIADQFTGMEGPIFGEHEFGVGVGSDYEQSFGVSRFVYYSGTAVVRENDQGQFPDVQISGAADFTSPTMTISEPAGNVRWSNAVITLRGRASDNAALDEVYVKVNGEDYNSVYVGGTNGPWSLEVPLTPGPNAIEAAAVDRTGNVSSSVRRKVTFVVPSPLTLEWDDGGAVLGATNGQLLEVNRTYTIVAKPGATNLFAGWTGDLTSSVARLKFVMQTNLALRATFVPNLFLAIQGTYNGLFSPAAAPLNLTDRGYFALSLRDKGAFTGKLMLNGGSSPFRGQCNPYGHCAITIPKFNLSMDLQFDVNSGTETLEGTVSNAQWVAGLVGQRVKPLDGASPYSGSYTFVIPGAPAHEASSRPAGDGAGTLVIDANGSATFAGSAGDGAPFSQRTAVSKNGAIPLYASPGGGGRLLSGWLRFSPEAVPYAFVGSNVAWIKVPSHSDPTYPVGYAESKLVLGAKYATGSPPAWTNGVVLFDGGNLTSTASNRVQWIGNQFVVLDLNPLQITLGAPSAKGTFSGSFLHPVTGRRSAFKVAMLQLPTELADWGGGWFRGTNESGSVRVLPAIP